MAGLAFAMPLAIGIVILLAILTLSYEQTIHAYPSGGGSYIVARDNLGELPAQTAGAALLTDYILTVAVSISSGVAQITSAFPSLYPERVWISVALVMFVMLINLRGVKESGAIFAHPDLLLRRDDVHHRGGRPGALCVGRRWAWWSIRRPWRCCTARRRCRSS